MFIKSFQKSVHRWPKVIFWPQNMFNIIPPISGHLCGYPTTLGWVNLKHVCLAKFLPLNGIFGYGNFGWWGPLFSTKWLDTKLKLTRHQRQKNTYILCMKVDSWHVWHSLGGNSSNSPTVHLSGQNLVANSWSDS